MNYHSSLLLREAQTLAHMGSRRLIEAAVSLIELRHDVDEETAYAMLVQRAIEEHRSVRATAVSTLADPPGRPLA